MNYKEKFEQYLKPTKLYPLYELLEDKFCTAPAGKGIHHNFEGGLLRHVVEMIEFGLPIVERLTTPDGTLLIDPNEFVNVCFLHDLAKIEFYEPIGTDSKSFGYVKHQFTLQEMVVQNYCAKAGIELTDNEMNALWLAEGGFSPVFKEVDRTPLATMLHIVDLFSSQLLQPKMVSQSKCPSCGKGEIVQRSNSSNGSVFYSCNRFPECKTIVSKAPELILTENILLIPTL